MYKPIWKRNPNLEYKIGTKCNNSHIVEIKHPEDPSAYSKYWSGQTRWVNPKWMDVVLASGKTITSKELELDAVQ